MMCRLVTIRADPFSICRITPDPMPMPPHSLPRPGLHQDIGADTAGDGGGHVIQGVGVRLELIQADGQMTASAVKIIDDNDPAHGVGQTEQNPGYRQPYTALPRMVDSAQGQAAQQDGDKTWHAEEGNARHARNYGGDRQPGPAAGSVQYRGPPRCPENRKPAQPPAAGAG